MNYLENFNSVLAKANSRREHFQSGKGWDNRKRKMYARHVPRGKVYQRLSRQDWLCMRRDLSKRLGEFSAQLENLAQ